MKRLLLAMGLALALHALLLRAQVRWIDKREAPATRQTVLTVSLAHGPSPGPIPKPPALTLPPSPKPLPRKVARKMPVHRPQPSLPQRFKKAVPAKKPERPQVPRRTPSVQGPAFPGEGVEDARIQKKNQKALMQRAARGGTGEGVKQPQVHQLREAIPRYRTNPLPHYPQLARRRGLQGTVMLMVLVNRSGKVNDVRVFTSSGHRILDKSAVASVRKWQFEPATRGGKPVRMWVRVPIRFELK